MDRNIWIVGIIVAVAAIVYVLGGQGSAEAAVIGKICGTNSSQVHLYSCGQGIYAVASLPDIGTGYYDSYGTKLAQCGGFIVNGSPPECANYTSLTCDRTRDLCVG